MPDAATALSPTCWRRSAPATGRGRDRGRPTGGGNVTLFAFDGGQGLTEHTSPFDALVMVLEGALTLTIGATPVRATPDTIVRMPADVPHALEAAEPARILLIMLRDPKAG